MDTGCAENKINILCVGPKGSGKTMLLKKMQCSEDIDNTYSTVPTIGTNIFDIHFQNKSGKRETLSIREVGGEMTPILTNYLDCIKKVIYVVDTSNLCQISAAAVLLYTLLSEPRLSKAKFVLVLSKMDSAYRQMRNEALLMLQYSRLRREVPQPLVVMETSAITGEGVQALLQMLTGVKPKENPL